MTSGRAAAWAIVVVAPLWLIGSVLAARPDGKLHIFFVPGVGNEAALVVTPAGRAAWLWDGRGDVAALVATTRPLLARPDVGVDVAIGPGSAQLWPGARELAAEQLAPGTMLRLDDAVTLTRLPATDGWMLECGQFRTLLPSTLNADVQVELLVAGADVRMTVMKAPGPDTGAWPIAAFLAASAPQRILWPQDTTYPPEVDRSLAATGAARTPADAAIEIITDGQRIWMRERSGETQR
jgi:hypothetical protein